MHGHRLGTLGEGLAASTASCRPAPANHIWPATGQTLTGCSSGGRCTAYRHAADQRLEVKRRPTPVSYTGVLVVVQGLMAIRPPPL